MILLPLSKQLEYETPSRNPPWELSPHRPMASRRASFGEDAQASQPSEVRPEWHEYAADYHDLSWSIMNYMQEVKAVQRHHAPSLQNQKIATGSRGRALCDRFSKVLVSLMTLLMHPRHGMSWWCLENWTNPCCICYHRIDVPCILVSWFQTYWYPSSPSTILLAFDLVIGHICLRIPWPGSKKSQAAQARMRASPQRRASQGPSSHDGTMPVWEQCHWNGPMVDFINIEPIPVRSSLQFPNYNHDDDDDDDDYLVLHFVVMLHSAQVS